MTATPTYALRPSFLGTLRASRDAAIIVAGVAFDLGPSNRPGARLGPAATRQASRMLADEEHPLAQLGAAALDFADIGDLRVVHGDIAATLTELEEQAAALAHLVAFGGDHSITLPLLRALARRTGPLGLVHFDAHVSTRPATAPTGTGPARRLWALSRDPLQRLRAAQDPRGRRPADGPLRPGVSLTPRPRCAASTAAL